MEKKFYLTKEGLEKIKKEYQNLKKIKQAKISEKDNIPEAFHSEELNPDYVYFQEDLLSLETRIIELDQIMKNSEVIKNSRSKKSVVGVGATVVVENRRKSDQFIIVEAIEANPFDGKISKESPVGKALLGSSEGDEIKIPLPIGETYIIKKINYFTS